MMMVGIAWHNNLTTAFPRPFTLHPTCRPSSANRLYCGPASSTRRPPSTGNNAPVM